MTATRRLLLAACLCRCGASVVGPDVVAAAVGVSTHAFVVEQQMTLSSDGTPEQVQDAVAGGLKAAHGVLDNQLVVSVAEASGRRAAASPWLVDSQVIVVKEDYVDAMRTARNATAVAQALIRAFAEQGLQLDVGSVLLGEPARVVVTATSTTTSTATAITETPLHGVAVDGETSDDSLSASTASILVAVVAVGGAVVLVLAGLLCLQFYHARDKPVQQRPRGGGHHKIAPRPRAGQLDDKPLGAAKMRAMIGSLPSVEEGGCDDVAREAAPKAKKRIFDMPPERSLEEGPLALDFVGELDVEEGGCDDVAREVAPKAQKRLFDMLPERSLEEGPLVLDFVGELDAEAGGKLKAASDAEAPASALPPEAPGPRLLGPRLQGEHWKTTLEAPAPRPLGPQLQVRPPAALPPEAPDSLPGDEPPEAWRPEPSASPRSDDEAENELERGLDGWGCKLLVNKPSRPPVLEALDPHDDVLGLGRP